MSQSTAEGRGHVRLSSLGQDGRMPLMRRAEIEEPATPVRMLLVDPDADLNEPLRRRWEGRLITLSLDPTCVVDTPHPPFL